MIAYLGHPELVVPLLVFVAGIFICEKNDPQV